MPQKTPPQRFIVDETTPPVIVSALRHWLPALSWSKVRNLMRNRRVAVGGALCLNEGRKLNKGEYVEVYEQPLPPPPQADDVVLHHVDRDLVVVEKPPRMMTLRHHAEQGWPQWRKRLAPTLEEVIPDLIYSANRKHRPGVYSVHRIDRDTSGLLVFARSEEVQQKLIEQFAQHDVARVYRAIVPGVIKEQTISTFLVRDRGDQLRGSSPDHKGREATTHLRPIRTLTTDSEEAIYSEIECRLETGRTHQIRIHLAEIGRPVCGDVMYRGRFGEDPIADHSNVPHLALHAAQLGFTHPTRDETLHFDVPWQRAMRRYLARLEGSAENRTNQKKTRPHG